MTQTTAPHPYQTGYRDRCKNAVAWDNPFRADTWQRYAWQSGWEQCSVHMAQDRAAAAADDAHHFAEILKLVKDWK